MIPNRRLTGHVIQKPGDQVNGLLHRGHPDRGLEQVGLGEVASDRDGQVLIQRRDGTSTTFSGFQGAILSAGAPSFR